MEARSVRKPASVSSAQGSHGHLPGDNLLVKECGVDWITVTCKEPELRYQMREFGVSLLQSSSWSDGKCKPWSFMGFEGLRADGIAFGEQDAMAICRLSGPTASAYWSRAYELSTNVSRIDLQITASGVNDPSALILSHHQASLDHYKKFSNPPTVDLRLSNRTGNTLYYNTRASSRFGRVYDKGFESKLDHYKSCVRYECQVNGRTARDVARKLYSSKDREATIYGGVSRFFRNHRCAVPGSGVINSLLSSPRSRSNDHRRLTWLSTQVRGALEDLIARGKGKEALAALGLPPETLDHMVHQPDGRK